MWDNLKNLPDLMGQAKELKGRMEQLQDDLTRQTVEADAGAGAVRVTVNGKLEVISVRFDQLLLISLAGEGSDMDHSVAVTASYASMVHIKDGSKKDGNVTFCLPGEGGIDVGKFFRALQRNDLSDLPVFAEVSVQQSGDPAYDPEHVAKFCFDVLNQGRLSLEQ